jgi:hypothetical protein
VGAELAGLNGLPGGSHMCWVLNEEAWYGDLAAGYLGEGEDPGQKTIVFGPESSGDLVALGEIAKTAIAPHVAFLEGRSLEPQAMFAIFREQSAIARAEGPGVRAW